MVGKTDIDDLRTALIDRAADLAIALLGEPNHAFKSKLEMRWGNKGSMAVTVAGAKAGLWADHERGVGGDLFALIMLERCHRFPDAVRYAREFCGMDSLRCSSSATAAARPSSCFSRDVDDDARAKQALAIFEVATTVDHPVAKRYFERRKLILPNGVDGNVLRFHRHCPFGRGERRPAIIAMYNDIKTDKPRAICRIALTAEGEKIDRKMLGPIGGCACKLSPDENVTTGLHIAEGIETSLAAMMLGFIPMWAMGSAGAIAHFPVLAGIECLTIISDNDRFNPRTGKTPGQAAARECSQRWTGAGIAVRRVVPTVTGEDMADIVKRQEAAHG